MLSRAITQGHGEIRCGPTFWPRIKWSRIFEIIMRLEIHQQFSMERLMISLRPVFAGAVLKLRSKEQFIASRFLHMQIEEAINLTPTARVNLDSISI
jgi:hypothetical protein